MMSIRSILDEVHKHLEGIFNVMYVSEHKQRLPKVKPQIMNKCEYEQPNELGGRELPCRLMRVDLVSTEGT